MFKVLNDGDIFQINIIMEFVRDINLSEVTTVVIQQIFQNYLLLISTFFSINLNTYSGFKEILAQ